MLSLCPTNYAILEASDSHIGLFSKKVTDTSIADIREKIHKPKSDSAACITFDIDLTTQYLDLKKTSLYLQVQILHGDGTSLAANENVALTNLPIATLFSQLDVSIQGQSITRLPTPTYALNGYLQTLLSSGEDVHETYLEASGYYKQAGAYSADVYSHVPKGEKDPKVLDKCNRSVSLNFRNERAAKSRIMEFEGPVYCDLFDTDTFLLNNTRLTLCFWQATDAFRLIAPDNKQQYKVKIVDSSLKMTHVYLTSEVLLAHEMALQKQVASYFFYQTNSRFFSASKGDLYFSASDVFNSLIPSKLYMFFIPSDAMNGKINKNCLRFPNYNASSVAVSCNGICYPSGIPYKLNYDQNICMQPYYNLFKVLKMTGKNVACDLNFADWKESCNIFAYDFDGVDINKAAYLPPVRSGSVDIEIQFASKLPEAITVVVLAKYPRCMTIDSARNVVL